MVPPIKGKKLSVFNLMHSSAMKIKGNWGTFWCPSKTDHMGTSHVPQIFYSIWLPTQGNVGIERMAEKTCGPATPELKRTDNLIHVSPSPLSSLNFTSLLLVLW